MSNEAKRIDDKAWNFATVLWHDGVPYLAYAEEITFLLVLKVADELTKPPHTVRIGDATGTLARGMLAEPASDTGRPPAGLKDLGHNHARFRSVRNTVLRWTPR